MNKRDTLRALIGAGLAGTPLLARAQATIGNTQASHGTRRVGVLMTTTEGDPESQLRLVSFKERLAVLGWAEGRNLTLDVRWTAGDVERAALFAKELVALKPDVIFANATSVTAAVQKLTSTIPVVFTSVADPVGSGFVKSLARPGGNLTGFSSLEASLVEKWLQLLKELAPRTKRAGVMFNPKTAPYAEFYLERLSVVAPKIGVKTFSVKVASEADIEKAISALGREPGGAMIFMPDIFTSLHRRAIIDLTARHKVPAVYYGSNMAVENGLISYGVDFVDQFRRAAPYVDRILRGAKPAELPVQQPTLLELVINLRTAKALGLTVPHSIMVRADRVIE